MSTSFSLIVAIVTAIVTVNLNNQKEIERLQAMWKRETKERVAQHRRQRLAEMVQPLRDHTNRLVEIFAMTPADRLDLMGEGGMRAEAVHALRERLTAKASAQSLGDEELLTGIREFHHAVGKAVTMARQKNTADEEWRAHADEVTQKAAAVLGRCAELPDEAYADALAEE